MESEWWLKHTHIMYNWWLFLSLMKKKYIKTFLSNQNQNDKNFSKCFRFLMKIKKNVWNLLKNKYLMRI